MKLSLMLLLAFNVAAVFLVPLLTPMIRDHIGPPIAPAHIQATHATQARLPVSVPYDPAPRMWHALLEPRKGTTTPLMAAVTDPSGRIARALLKTGAEVNQADNFGVTSLMWAAAFNPSANVARMLIEAGSEVNACDDSGNTALILAAHYGRSAEVVRALIDLGAKVDAQNDNGLTPLMAATVRGGRLGWFFPNTFGPMSTAPEFSGLPTGAAFEEYERRWKIELTKSTGARTTPHASFPSGIRHALVYLFLVGDAPPTSAMLMVHPHGRATDQNALPPLGNALFAALNKATGLASLNVHNEHLEGGRARSLVDVVEIWREARANNEVERTKMSLAIESFPSHVQSLLTQDSTEWLEVVEVGSRGELEVAAEIWDLFLNDVPFEQKPLTVHYLLGRACNVNSLRLVRTLIDAGTDVNSSDSHGMTPLLWAAHKSSSASIIQTLIDAGADVDAKSVSGYTPLMHAAARENQVSLQVLLDAGADADATDKHGSRALDYARENESIRHTSTFALLRTATEN